MFTTPNQAEHLPAAVIEEGKADFLELLYRYSGRTNGLYTGLWADFCREAGETARTNFTIAHYTASITTQDQVRLDPNSP
jgi:hypothetical protein